MKTTVLTSTALLLEAAVAIVADGGTVTLSSCWAGNCNFYPSSSAVNNNFDDYFLTNNSESPWFNV
jgi:hypothetical protein